MTINIDFDGTCVTHDFPNIGKEIGAIPILKKLVESGHQLILFTMRSDDNLKEAINWFSENGIELYGIQTNPTQKNWTNSPKSYAEMMIDDSALGCPLAFDEKLSNRPFVNWNVVEVMLKERGII
jgi:hypothetical protein